MPYVLSTYPLSLPYRSALESRTRLQFEYLTVTELRQKSARALLARLYAVKGGDLYIAIEDETSRALLPMLGILSALSRARRLYIVDESNRSREFSRLQALAGAIRLSYESVLAAFGMWKARRAMRKLLRADRVVVRKATGTHVAYLNCNLWFGVKAGGSVGHISGVVNALTERGHSVDFYTVGGRLLVNERANLAPINPPAMLAVPFEKTYYRFDMKCGRQIAEDFEKRLPSFIYQRMSIGNFTGVRLSRTFGLPLVLEYNGSEAWVAKNWGKPLKYHDAAVDAENVCLRHAHVVVTVSEVLGDELVKRGVERDRIVVYPNCIDPASFDPARFGADESRALRALHGFSPDDVVASFIGTFGQWHGVDILAQAVRQMIDRDRKFIEEHGLRFLLIGDGKKMAAVRTILADAADGPFVRLTGLVAQREAPGYLAASDILLSPHVRNPDGSAFFGSPTKLFEYMAMNRGIIASDLDQLGAILRPAIADVDVVDSTAPRNEVAILVPPGDVQRLVDAIKFLVVNVPVRHALGRNARRLALSRYTWRHHTQAILDGLDTALQ